MREKGLLAKLQWCSLGLSEWGFQSRLMWVQVSAQLLNSCVSLGKLIAQGSFVGKKKRLFLISAEKNV